VTDPDRELYIPPVQLRRGGVTHWDMVDAELRQLPGVALAPLDLTPTPTTERLGQLVASGGWCAPVGSWYDIVDRTPWTHADLPLWWDVDVDRWLFPRLTATRRAWARFRRRLRNAWLALRAPVEVHVDDEDDDW
jgi:hypothetical protein